MISDFQRVCLGETERPTFQEPESLHKSYFGGDSPPTEKRPISYPKEPKKGRETQYRTPKSEIRSETINREVPESTEQVPSLQRSKQRRRMQQYAREGENKPKPETQEERLTREREEWLKRKEEAKGKLNLGRGTKPRDEELPKMRTSSKLDKLPFKTKLPSERDEPYIPGREGTMRPGKMSGTQEELYFPYPDMEAPPGHEVAEPRPEIWNSFVDFLTSLTGYSNYHAQMREIGKEIRKNNYADFDDFVENFDGDPEVLKRIAKNWYGWQSLH